MHSFETNKGRGALVLDGVKLAQECNGKDVAGYQLFCVPGEQLIQSAWKQSMNTAAKMLKTLGMIQRVCLEQKNNTKNNI